MSSEWGQNPVQNRIKPLINANQSRVANWSTPVKKILALSHYWKSNFFKNNVILCFFFFFILCIINICSCWLVVTESLINHNVAYWFSMEIVGFLFLNSYEGVYFLAPFHNIIQLVLIFPASSRCCPKEKKGNNTTDISVGVASNSYSLWTHTSTWILQFISPINFLPRKSWMQKGMCSFIALSIESCCGACASSGILAGSVQLSGSWDCVEEEETLSTMSVRSLGHFLGMSLLYGESCTT